MPFESVVDMRLQNLVRRMVFEFSALGSVVIFAHTQLDEAGELLEGAGKGCRWVADLLGYAVDAVVADMPRNAGQTCTL